MKQHERDAVGRFFAQADDTGMTNAEKARTRQRIIQRVASTPKDKSFEVAEDPISPPPPGMPIGVVEVDGKLIGLGIHIFNEDVYPLQSFEITLRDCDLVGDLDLSGCADLVFVDLYRNRIGSVDVAGTPALRILGLQSNQIEHLDARGMPACQGIDIGNNRLTDIDVSGNPELVELYVNDNALSALDTTCNPKLKYLRCQNNNLHELDVTAGICTRPATRLRASRRPRPEAAATCRCALPPKPAGTSACPSIPSTTPNGRKPASGSRAITPIPTLATRSWAGSTRTTLAFRPNKIGSTPMAPAAS